MLNLDDITNENNQDHNKKRPYIPDHPYRMLIIGSSGSGKTNALLNLIKEQDSDNFTDKIYLYAKDLNEQKKKIKKPDDAGIKHLNDPKAFIEYSQCIDDVDNNVNDYNLHRKRKISVVFDDMIADIMTNKINIIEELFIRCRKWNIYLVFIIESSFSVPKGVRLLNNEDLQQKRAPTNCYQSFSIYCL